MRSRVHRLLRSRTTHLVLTNVFAALGAIYLATQLAHYDVPPLLMAAASIALFTALSSNSAFVLEAAATRVYRCPDCLVSAHVTYGTPADHEVYRAMVADHPHHRSTAHQH
ncbi:hypothetical protein [Streptomyces buecherae]|uniref:hypothetical protein n=1 Tax=Streptomyces buecherae TaxID=2763006 RepID=UPI00379D60E1